MMLLTKELERTFASFGRQEGPANLTIVIAKFFHPMSLWTRYATEYDPEERVFYGIVHGFEIERGYFSLRELEETKIYGIGFERDRHRAPTNAQTLIKRLKKQRDYH